MPEPIGRLLRGFHGIARDLQAELQAPQIDVIPRHIANDRDERGVAHLGKRLGIIVHRFEQAAVFAPNVELPRRVEAGNPGHIVEAARVRAGIQSLRHASLRHVAAAGAGAGSSACLRSRQHGTDDGDLLRADGLNAGQRDLKIGVADDGPVDEAVQLGIAQRLPPADGFGIRGGFLRHDLARGGSKKRRQRDLWSLVIRANRAAAERGGAASQQKPAMNYHKFHPPTLAAFRPKQIAK